jgi:SAM-dependent methyltransferase
VITKSDLAKIVLEPKMLDEYVIEDIHPDDDMFVENRDHYFSCGRDAVKKILGIHILNNIETPEVILDFACGYGRVTRYLRAAFPTAQITVSDLVPEAVDFGSTAFSATANYSIKDFNKINMQQKQNLIWSGSLMTHLDESKSKDLLNFFSKHLQPGGVAVFTTHGRYVAKRAHQDNRPYGIAKDTFIELSHKFENGEFAYADYDNQQGYGISITPLKWLFENIAADTSIRLVGLIERGWDNHQDVVAIQKYSVI